MNLSKSHPRMDLFSKFDIEKKIAMIKSYFNSKVSKAQVLSTMSQVVHSPFRTHEIDLVVRILVILAALSSIYSSCRRKKSLDQKEEADKNVKSLLILEACRIADEKLVKDVDEYTGISSPRLDAMELKVKEMARDLSYLRTLCPLMNDRKITFGKADSMWPIPSLGHGDFVIVHYTLVDVLDETVVKTSRAQHLDIGVPGCPVPATEILLPAGTRIVVTKAVRIPRGVRDMENSVDLTSSAKVALESSLTRTYR